MYFIIESLREQFGAALEMLQITISNCPENLWKDQSQGPAFWQVVHHTLFYVDWYASISKEEREEYQTPFPSISRKLDQKTEEIMQKENLMGWLYSIQAKISKNLTSLDGEKLKSPSIFEWHGSSMLSSWLYNLRHLMHHVGALSKRIHQSGIPMENWISQKKI